MPTFSKRSLNELKNVHPDLVKVMTEAIKDTPVDFVVICGHRGKEAQDLAFAEGKSKLKYPKSRHNIMPAEAVDIVPYVGGKISWGADYYKPLALHILHTAETLGVPLTWGGTFKTLVDMPHFELKRKTK